MEVQPLSDSTQLLQKMILDRRSRSTPERAPAARTRSAPRYPRMSRIERRWSFPACRDDGHSPISHVMQRAMSWQQSVDRAADRQRDPTLSPALTQVAAGTRVPSPTMLDNLPLEALKTSRPPIRSRWSWPPPCTPRMSSASGADAAVRQESWERPSKQRPSSCPPSIGTGPVRAAPVEETVRCAEEDVPVTARPSPSTTLAELAYLVRLQKDLARRCHRVRTRVHRCLVSSGLYARCARSAQRAQRNLVEFYKQDDKRGFAALYHAVHDVRSSCDALRRYTLMEPGLDVRIPGNPETGLDAPGQTFWDQIPVRMKDDFLHLLSEIRTNPDFLASRLVSLSLSELVGLASSYQALDSPDAGSSSSSRTSWHGGTARRSTTSQTSPIEQLLSFQRRDPLSALLHTVFAESGGPHAAEDRRRTEVWSSACARLITEGTPGGEQFMRVALNAWAALRDWPCKPNLELYLMAVLQEGAFLLDAAGRRVPDQGPASDARAKDLAMADEFYDGAITKLLALLVEQPTRGGIPSGALEIGRAIMRKVVLPKKQRAARTFMVCKWFFSSFLLDAIVYPEMHGMMTDHHIPTPARQKILREIAVRAQRHVWDVSFDWKPLRPIAPEIRQHIETISAWFSDDEDPSSQSSHPTRVIPTPPETSDIHPYLLVCPSDVLVLINALFPERRPSSSAGGDLTHLQGFRSIASTSDPSLPLHSWWNSQGTTDRGSMVSISGSSMTSESTSYEPGLERFGQQADGMSSYTSVGSRDTLLDLQQPDSAESYSHLMRSHASQLSTYLGPEAVLGALHPCRESWTIVYILDGGKSLTTGMPNDSDHDEAEPSENQLEPDDVGLVDEGHAPTVNYFQVQETIYRLVQDYDISGYHMSNSESTVMTNRLSRLQQNSEEAIFFPAGIHGTSVVTSRADRTSPVASASAAGIIETVAEVVGAHDAQEGGLKEKDHSIGLVEMLESAIADCQTRMDFVAASEYWETLQQLQISSTPPDSHYQYGPLLEHLAKAPRKDISSAASAIESYDAWSAWLQQTQQRRRSALADIIRQLGLLRDKIWYVTDVRNSAAYDDAKNIATALKYMGDAPKSSKIKSSIPFLPRHFGKGSERNQLLKSEAQVVALLSTSLEQGGLSKLSDEQSEMTLHWLEQRKIQNLCKGEERIHRFCLEIERCVNRLVGHGITDAPVLWSSELYTRDQQVLETGHQLGDLTVTEFGTLMITSQDGPGRAERKATTRGSDRFGRPLPLAVQSEYSLQQPLGPSSGVSRGPRNQVDLLTSYRPFSTGGMDSRPGPPMAFWSPFLKQLESSGNGAHRATSRELFQKGYASGKGATGSAEKRAFLASLKQRLVSLLLSDLGDTVWGKGSETDAWFSSELGERFLARRDGNSQQSDNEVLKQPSTSTESGHVEVGRSEPSSVAHPHILPIRPATSDLQTEGGTKPATTVTPPTTAQHHGTEQPPASPTTSESLPTTQSTFPYESSFRRLLHLFSTHPSPFTKLHALRELASLIALSNRQPSSTHSTTRARAISNARISPIPNRSPASVFLSSNRPPTRRGNKLDDMIADYEQRRDSGQLHRTSSLPWLRNNPDHPSSSSSPKDPSTTHQIVTTLGRLFRDPSTRPKSLFRDLQFIASFIPSHILDDPSSGSAFWNASLAALGLKQDVCRQMVEMADDIVAYHTKTRTIPSSSHPSIETGPTTTTTTAELSRFRMADAARMLAIPAKEGDPVAQRELAIFYLTHPDLVARTTLPLSKPRETFKVQMMNPRDEDPARSDPATMCVAYHWMELSSQGGDQLARQYLQARAELNALP